MIKSMLMFFILGTMIACVSYGQTSNNVISTTTTIPQNVVSVGANVIGQIGNTHTQIPVAYRAIAIIILVVIIIILIWKFLKYLIAGIIIFILMVLVISVLYGLITTGSISLQYFISFWSALWNVISSGVISSSIKGAAGSVSNSIINNITS